MTRSCRPCLIPSAPAFSTYPPSWTPLPGELNEYFDGQRHGFDVPLDWRLSAGCRSTVLDRLPEIGYGREPGGLGVRLEELRAKQQQ